MPNRNTTNANTSTIAVGQDLQPYLDEIATRLYTKRAAVMVGAGFSRNATPESAVTSGFPDWTAIGEILLAKLKYNDERRHTKFLSVPTLAHEVEAAFGRTTLTQILRDAIPDTGYKPSPLHTQLLNLPWTDVFTTNYDTLLERASRTNVNQRYDHVTKQQDLVSAEQPRIIKLHGDLQSPKRLVITDEDYRAYPTNFAPLLNTVRQSLLENTLCMIGFSGSDPNFLHWIGWIHDNLGKQHSPKMYLIALSRLSDTQTQLMADRNIVVVDMTKADGITARDHHSALSTFLTYLQSRRLSADNLNWPNTLPRQSQTSPQTDLTELEALVTAWESERKSYPGWVVVPEDRRALLIQDTEQQIGKWWGYNRHKIPEILDTLDLRFAYEMIWRTEKCLSPIFGNQIEYYESVIERYWTAVSTLPNSNTPHAAEASNNPSRLVLDGLETQFHHILLATTRFFREEGMLTKWETGMQRLAKRMSTMTPVHRAQFHYEKALGALFNLDIHKLLTCINEWPIDDSLPFWEAKRAGILAEIGQLDDAKRILRESLVSLRNRSNLQPVARDYSLLSQEASVMLLLQYLPVPFTQITEIGSIQKEFEPRWHKLQEFKCDLRRELRILELLLKPPHMSRSPITHRPNFDIGSITRTVSFMGRDSEAAAAYNFVRLCEDIGVPLDTTRTSAEGVLPRIASDSPYWAIISLVRLGNDKPEVVDCIFGRKSLTSMDVDLIDSLIDRFLKALDSAKSTIKTMDHSWAWTFGTRLANSLPSILSRLCSKCSIHSRTKILGFLDSIYRSESRHEYSGISVLTRRLLNAMSPTERIASVTTLLEFPILTNLDPLQQFEIKNPFVFLSIQEKWITQSLNLPPERIKITLAACVSNDEDTRKWALLTLHKLCGFGLLDCEQLTEFGKVLWSQVGEDGWPDKTVFLRHELLRMPCPKTNAPMKLFLQQLTHTAFPDDPDPSHTTHGGGQSSWHDIMWACQHLSLPEDVLGKVLDMCFDWWNLNRSKVDRMESGSGSGFGGNDFKRAVVDVVKILSGLIQTVADLNDIEDTRPKVQALISDLAPYDMPVRCLECVTLDWFPENRERVLRDIRLGISSSEASNIGDSVRAVRVLLDKSAPSENGDLNTDTVQLLNFVGQLLFWHKQPGVIGAINLMSYVLTQHADLFNQELERLVLEGLQVIVRETDAVNAEGSDIQDHVDEMHFAYGLEARRDAASLAYKLFKFYSTKGVTLPSIVLEWKATCSSIDEFAEIRNEWLFDCDVV